LGLAVPYNLIILDIMLPRIDGFEVCRQLRDQKRMTPMQQSALERLDQALLQVALQLQARQSLMRYVLMSISERWCAS